MSDLYNVISALCEQHGKTVYKLCKDIGVRGSVLSDLKTGRKKGLSAETLSKIAEHFSVSVDYLLGNEQNKKAAANNGDGSNVVLLDEKLVRFPIVGSISAGYTSLAVEEYTGEFAAISLSDLHGPFSEYFVLRVSGDSMYPYLLDGDRVLVHRTNIVDNGKIAVVLYNGDEATIKRVNYKQGEYIDLIPNNPEYKTKRIKGADLEQCHILGEVVQLMRSLI